MIPLGRHSHQYGMTLHLYHYEPVFEIYCGFMESEGELQLKLIVSYLSASNLTDY